MKGMETFMKSITVEPILFGVNFVDGMESTVLKDLVYQRICTQKYNTTICDDLNDHSDALTHVQTSSSYYLMVLRLALMLPAVVVSNMYGYWGDRYSRKLQMMMPNIGSLVSTTTLIAVSAIASLPIHLIILGYVVFSLFGGYVTVLSSTVSYLTSVTSAQTRLSRFALADAADKIGASLGPFAAGFLKGPVGYEGIFVFCFVIYIATLVYILIMIKGRSNQVAEDGEKSATEKDTTQSGCSKYFSLSDYKESFLVLLKRRPNNGRSLLLSVLMCRAITIAAQGVNYIEFLYLRDNPIQLSFEEYSFLSGLNMALISLASLLMFPLTRLFNISDVTVAIASTAIEACTYAYMGLCRTSAAIYFFPLIGMFSGILDSANSSIISKHVPSSEHGQVFATRTVLFFVVGLASGMTYAAFYPQTRSFYNGSLFLVSAVILIIPIIIYLFWRDRINEVDKKKDEESNNQEEIKTIPPTATSEQQ